MKYNLAEVVTVEYRNYRGEKALRKIIPRKLIFSRNEWHTENQWLLECFDLEKKQNRTFAVKDISKWEESLADVSQ